ncbi:MAG: hypothetical protein ACREBE_04170 [bacterium]
MSLSTGSSQRRACRSRSSCPLRSGAVQQEAVKALLEHDIGVFVAPPGVGKTVIGTYLVAARRDMVSVMR